MTTDHPPSEKVIDNPTATDNTVESNQIQKTSTDRKWLNIGLILLLLGIIAGGWYWWQSQQSQASQQAQQAPPPSGVKLKTLTSATIEESTNFLGNLEAQQTVNLNSELEGRLVGILISEGQIVNRGDSLFRLESDTLNAELNQASATVNARLAQLTELQTGSRIEDVAAAQARVRQAQIRLDNSRKGSSQAEIAQAQAQLVAAEAEAQLAQQKVKRYRLLLTEGAIAQDQFDNFLTEAKTSQAQVNVAQKRLQELRQGTTSNNAELEAALDEAKQNLTLLQNGARQEQIAQATAQVQEARANVARIRTLLDKSLIKAPISGKISNIPVKIGDYIDSDDTLTTITENSALELNIAIPIEKAVDLQIGLPVQLLDDNNKTIATGQINFIEPNVTSDSQLINVKAVFDNSDFDRQLLNRQFIQSRIIWNLDRGILIPTSSIFRIGGQAFVFTAEENPDTEGLVAKQKAIKLGDIQGNSYQVLEGLENGDRILTAGILQVRDGSPIQQIAETDTNNTSSNNN